MTKPLLDRQYGHEYTPPRQTPSSSRFVQPEEVIGTVSGREEMVFWRRVLDVLKASKEPARRRMIKFYATLYGRNRQNSR